MTASVFFFIRLLQCVIQNIIRAESNSRWMQIIHTNLQSNFKHQSLFCQVIAMSKFSHSLILLCLRWFNYSLDANELNEEKEIEGQRERESECLWSSFPKLKQFQNISNCFWRVWNVSSYQVNIERMSTKNMLLSFWWVLTVFRHKCMHTFDTLQTHSIKIRNIVDFSCAPK